MTSHAAARSAAPAVAPHAATPAPPTDREIEILHRILGDAQFEGSSDLRDQVRMLQVAPGSSATCRIYLLHPDAPRASMPRRGRSRIPGTYRVQWLDGALLGDIGVWVEDGHLRALHYVGLTEREPLTLPPPDWIQCSVEAPPAAATRPSPAAAPDATAEREGRAWSARDTSGRGVAVHAPTGALRAHKRMAAALAACILLVLAMAVATGWSSGADVAAATRAGERDGQREAAADGATIGTLRGTTEGEPAGFDSTYRQAFDGARDRIRAQARQRRLKEARKAAAAAAAAVPVTVCPGYTDNRGVYVCTA